MPRLLIGSVDDTFVLGRDFPISPSCFIGREDRHPGWEGSWFAETDTAAGHALARTLAGILLPELAVHLNRTHDRTCSEGYWRILCTPWLMNVAMQVVKRWQEVSAAVEKWSSEAIEVAAAPMLGAWHVGDFDDFYCRILVGREFIFRLRSAFVRRMAPAAWRVLDAPATEVPARAAASDLQVASVRRVAHGEGMGRWQWAAIEALVRLLPGGSAAKTIGHSASARIAVPPVLEEVMRQAVQATCPAYLTDGYSEMERGARQRRYRSGKLRIPSPSAFNRFCAATFEIAHAHEAGERIVSAQHGAGYGVARDFALFAEAEYWHSGFLSWGWRSHDGYDCRAIPVAAPRLGAARWRGHVDGHVLLIGARAEACDYRHNSEPTAPQWLKYRAMKTEFIDALPEDVCRRLLYRPYNHACGLKDQGWIAAHHPRIACAEGAMQQHLSDCAMAVIDHPGTVMAQALAGNIPTICYWSPDHWPLTEGAHRAFGALRAVGILHERPQEAARQVAAVVEDVRAWWLSPEVQQARRGWCDQFARSRRLWAVDWAKALLTLRFR